MENCSGLLLVIYPGQGHINPSLEFAKRLIKIGAKVTLSTSLFAARRITEYEGLTVFPISHGYDEGFTKDEIQDFTFSFNNGGCQAIKSFIKMKANEGRPFTHVIYTTFMSWVGRVACKLGIPSTLLWIQPAFLFCIYYHYFNGYGEVISKCGSNDVVELPGLPVPLITGDDLPSFLLASTPDPYSSFLQPMKEHVEYLKSADNPRILVNTFDALEAETLKCMEHVKMVGIGPLVDSIFLNSNEKNSVNEWLNSKEDASVVYVAFGSYSVLPVQQIEEIARGLIETNKPFIWVMRPATGSDGHHQDKYMITCQDELEKLGLIVPWCSQIDVLSNPSVGCFVTHCGWNSSLESLVFGVPSVLVPLWNDQGTNAKLIEDVWKTGKKAKKNLEGFVESRELRRCIDIVMESEELSKNARKWKELVREANMENGSSNVNLQEFFDEVRAPPKL